MAAAFGRAGGFRWDEGAAVRGGPPGLAPAFRSGLARGLWPGFARLLRCGGIFGLEKQRRRSRGNRLRVRRGAWLSAVAEAPGARKEAARPLST